LGEQQTEGSSEDPKGLAKTMLQEGADIEAIMAETNLSKPTILGLKGVTVNLFVIREIIVIQKKEHERFAITATR